MTDYIIAWDLEARRLLSEKWNETLQGAILSIFQLSSSVERVYCSLSWSREGFPCQNSMRFGRTKKPPQCVGLGISIDSSAYFCKHIFSSNDKYDNFHGIQKVTFQSILEPVGICDLTCDPWWRNKNPALGSNASSNCGLNVLAFWRIFRMPRLLIW